MKKEEIVLLLLVVTFMGVAAYVCSFNNIKTNGGIELTFEKSDIPQDAH